MRKHDTMALYLLVDRLKKENKRLKAEIIARGGDPDRCPVMLPNAYGKEQCGRRRGHDGNCCYQRGD